jgi:pyruvate/2-oxoglutarate dehydrogenase complex dihydrolipoamide acyltransferase (E2) component
MPFGDLTVSEGRLVRWRVGPGGLVAASALVAEVETVKAVVEIETPRAVRITELFVADGAIVKMGQTITAIR